MQFASVHEQQQITQIASYYRDIRQLRAGVYEFPIDLQGGRLFLQIHIPREFPNLPPMLFVSSPVKHQLIGAGQRILYREERHWVPTMPIFEVVRGIHSEFTRSPPKLAKEEDAKTKDLSGAIKLLPPAERAKLADYASLKRYVDNLPEIQAKIKERDRLIRSNLELANSNIAKFQEPRASELDEDFTELSNLKDLVNSQKQQIEGVRARFSSQAIASVLKQKLSENQQTSHELTNSLANSEIHIDKYCKAYKQLRIQHRKLLALQRALA